MITRLAKPVSSALLCTALCLGTAAFAQDTPKAAKVAATAGDEYPDLFEIDPFGGVNIFGQLNTGLTLHTGKGGLGGVRIAYNPTPHFGLEVWADYVNAPMSFLASNVPGYGPYSFASHNWVLGLDPVFNILPRGSRIQPYVTGGVDAIRFTPSQNAIFNANSFAESPYEAGALRSNLQVGGNFGGGVKIHFTDHFGMRFDIRDLMSRNPTYGLPNTNNITSGIYIPSHQRYNGVQLTAGLVYFGGNTKCPPMPPAPAQPPALPTPSITGGEGTICQGKPVTLHATLPGVDPARKLSFAWTVNGQAQDANAPDLTFTPSNNSSFTVALTVTDTTPLPPPMEKPKKFPLRCWTQPAALTPVAPVTGSVTLTVADTTPTISSVSAVATGGSGSNLVCKDNQGPHTANLTGSATPGACGGNLTYKWTVSEGSVSGDSSPNATFDASSLSGFDPAQSQSKTVTATLTVTDPSGKSATQTTTINVKCEPTWVRLDDVIFAKNNARVNNCGKRLLIDDAASKMQSGDYDIILVAHRDTDEMEATGARGKGRHKVAPTPLDEQRALNAAAVLSGGTATCGKVDATRIKIDWEGTDQTSETRPGQCGTSATRATERKGSEVSEADKNRRVEVYLVPHGSTVMPPAVKNPQPLSDTTMKALGCPK